MFPLSGILAAVISVLSAQPMFDVEHRLATMSNASTQSVKESGTPISVGWLGQASFRITTSCSTSIIIDPVNFKGYHFPEGMTADIVTVSHEHIDHNAVEAVSGTPAVFRGTDHRCQVVNEIDTTVGDVKLYSVPSYHNPGGNRLNAIFVFEFDGIRLAHLGDLGLVLTAEQIEAIGEVDILMIPVGGQFTIAAAQADSIVSQLNVKRLVLPMHYKTEAFDALPYTAEPFLKGKENVRRLDTTEFIVDLAETESELEYVVMRY